MAQKEVVEEMMKISGLSRIKAKLALEQAGEAVLNTALAVGSAPVLGLGKIVIVERKGRVSELKKVKYTIAPKKAPSFIFSKHVKEAVK